MKINNGLTLAAVAMMSLGLASCLDDGNISLGTEQGRNPVVQSPTTQIPNVLTSIELEGDNALLRIDMTGIRDAYGNWLELQPSGTNRNIWVEIDNTPMKFEVINHNSSQQSSTVADLVFIVDNSGSMDDEANAIARDIQDWATQLSNSGLDIRFGCVGYDVWGQISGALNLTTATNLSQYLDRAYGTSRTVGFEGDDADDLQEYADNYSKAQDECGAVAVQYADQYLNFRHNANRIYVNFTDEPNQTNGHSEYSVEWFANQANWPSGKGTIHTVYSEDTASSWWGSFDENNERPWMMSEYTGGTTMFVPDDFEGVTLDNLPVTGAMTHSYVIRVFNVKKFLDGQEHDLHITILTPDGSVGADKVFKVILEKE